MSRWLARALLVGAAFLGLVALVYQTAGPARDSGDRPRSVRQRGGLRTDDSRGPGRPQPANDATEAVLTRADGFAPGTSRVVRVSSSETNPGVVMELSRGVSVRGVVLSSRGRLPIEGAVVERVENGPGMNIEFKAMDSTRTDRDGRFVLSNLAPGRIRIRASHGGLTSSECAIDENAADVELLLGEGGRVFGLVPAGATVIVSSEEDSDPRIAQPDDSGRFEVSHLPPGRYRVVVVPPDTVHTTPAEPRWVMVEDGGSVEVTPTTLATEGTRLSGTVRAGGRQVANAWIDLAGGRGEASYETVSDASGRYEMPRLAPGSYVAHVNGVSFTLEIQEGLRDERHDFDLPTGGLSGRVYAAETRDPLEGVEVTVSWAGAAGAPPIVRSAWTAPDGSYAVAGIEGGDYVVSANLDGRETRSVHVRVPEGRTLPGQDFALGAAFR